MQALLEVRMWRRHFYHRRFRGGWFFWIFGPVLVIALLGKSGLLPFVFPFFIIWLFGPKMRSFLGRNLPDFRRTPPQKSHLTPRRIPSPEVRSTMHRVQPRTNREDLDVTGPNCPACGGPVNHSTVEWRGRIAHCGYCGTKLR
jgi:hypothetical protein